MKSVIKILFFVIVTANWGFSQIKMSQSQKDEFLKDLVSSFENEYLWKEKGMYIAKELNSKIKNGDYSNTNNAEVFTAILNRDLYRLSKDLHLTIDLYNPEPNKQKETKVSVSKNPTILREVIEDGIFYLKFDSFPRMSVDLEKEIDDLMLSLTNAKTIIIDLRDNSGGSDQTINHIIGYFFEEKKKLATSYQWGKLPEEIWTVPKTQSQKLSDVELIILTSQSTFSAAEIFTQRLQKHNRAIVIGEKTPGAAHRTATYLMSDIFLLNWPYEESKHAEDNHDLEGVGIIPNYYAHYNKAKKVAIRFAKKRKIKVPKNISVQSGNKLTNRMIKALNSESDEAFQNFITSHTAPNSLNQVSKTLSILKTVWNNNLNSKIVNTHHVSDNTIRLFIKTNYGIRQIKFILDDRDKIVKLMTR